MGDAPSASHAGLSPGAALSAGFMPTRGLALLATAEVVPGILGAGLNGQRFGAAADVFPWADRPLRFELGAHYTRARWSGSFTFDTATDLVDLSERFSGLGGGVAAIWDWGGSGRVHHGPLARVDLDLLDASHTTARLVTLCLAYGLSWY